MSGVYDVIVIGSGAAGMMCAARAGRRGRSVRVLDHARAPGEKIRISGGGRCNFTNLNTTPKNFISANPHFSKSALSRYTPADFLALVERHKIDWHEKSLGQLFCDGTARQIVDMLLTEMRAGGVELSLSTEIEQIDHRDNQWHLTTSQGTVLSRALVIATGGKSIPKMGATGFAYKVAERFSVPLTETRPALVPLTLDPQTLEGLAPLSGVAVQARLSCGKTSFDEALLFTHRGLSGPAVLQISSYWREGEEIALRLEPEIDTFTRLKEARRTNGRQSPHTVLGDFLPKRLAQYVTEKSRVTGHLADLPDRKLLQLSDAVGAWRIKPSGSEGYRTAEVTLGGVDTCALDSRSMEVKALPGLFFIGECVDVTGWLGGYNFQWAWASGFVAGEAV